VAERLESWYGYRIAREKSSYVRAQKKNLTTPPAEKRESVRAYPITSKKFGLNRSPVELKLIVISPLKEYLTISALILVRLSPTCLSFGTAIAVLAHWSQVRCTPRVHCAVCIGMTIMNTATTYTL
jgi:hypothetical protein